MSSRCAGPARRSRVDRQPALALLREYHDHPLYMHLRPDAPDRAFRALFGATAVAARSDVRRRGRGSAAHRGHLRCVDTLSSPLLLPERYCYVSSAYVAPHSGNRACCERSSPPPNSGAPRAASERCAPQRGDVGRRRAGVGCPGLRGGRACQTACARGDDDTAHHDPRTRRGDLMPVITHFAHVRIGRV